MRKFLSILLAVMMVLSTVSFAAPSAIGSVQTTDDFVAVENTPAEEAELEAALTAAGDVDKMFGKEVINMTFDADTLPETVDIATVAGLTTDYAEGFGALTTVRQHMTTTDKGYLENSDQYPGFGIYDLHKVAKGYYTLVADITPASTMNLNFCGGNITYGASSNMNKKEGVVAALMKDASGNWTTATTGTNLSGAKAGTYGVTVDSNVATASAHFYIGTTNTVDNVKLYYRPKTVNVTLNVAGNTYTVKNVDTLAAADLDALVEEAGVYLGAKMVGSYSVNGVDYDAADALYLTDDVTVDVTLVNDPNKDVEKGKLLVGFTFDVDEVEYSGTKYTFALGATKNVEKSLNGHLTTSSAIEKEGDNGYLVLRDTAATSAFNVYECTTSKNEYKNIGERGIYTLDFKVRYENSSNAALTLRTTANEGSAEGTAAKGTLHDFSDSSFSATPNDTAWKQYSVSFDTTDWTMDSFGHISIEVGAGHSEVHIDDYKLYYKPVSTVDVTLDVDGETYVAEDMSTEGFDVADALAKVGVAVPAEKIAVASLTDGGETKTHFSLAYNATLYVDVVNDPLKDAVKGQTLVYSDFDNALARDLTGASERNWVGVFGGIENTIDASNVYGSYNYASSMATTADGTLKLGGAATYNQFNIFGINPVRLYQMAPTGIYEFSVDVKFSDNAVPTQVFVRWCESNNAGNAVIGSNYNQKGVTSLKNDGSWQTLTWTLNTNTDVTPWTNGLGKLELYVQLSTAGTIEYDNMKLTYKPFTANVTLNVDGEKYVAEDVSTAGISAEELCNAAGVIVPLGMKPVVSRTEGGETASSVTFAYDTELYVSFVDDESSVYDATHGRQLFKIGFEKYAVGDAIAGGKVSALADAYEADYANTSISLIGAGTIAGSDANKYTEGTHSNAQICIKLDNYAARPDGYYTYVIKTKIAGTSNPSFNAVVQAGNSPFPAAMWKNSGTVTGGADFAEYVAVYDGPKADYTWYYGSTGGNTVNFDDVTLYYKPKTVTVKVVTDEAGVEGVTLTGVSTHLGVLVSDLVANVDVSGTEKILKNVKLNGETYELTDTISFVANSEVELIFGVDEFFDFEKGTLVINSDFEGERTATAPNYWSSMVKSMGATVNEEIEAHTGLYHNLDSKFAPSDWNPTTSDVFVTEDDNTYIKVSHKGNYVVWGMYNNYKSDYYPFAGTEDPSIYTVEYDVKTFGDYNINLDRIDYANTSYRDYTSNGAVAGKKWQLIKTVTKNFDGSANNDEWTHRELTIYPSNLDNYALGSLKFYATSKSTSTVADAYVAWDNVRVYYKPAQVNATVYDQDGVKIYEGPMASEISVLDLAEAVGLDNPFKAIKEVKIGTRTYGSADTIKVAKDVVLNVTLGENELYHQENGSVLVYSHFEGVETGTYSQYGALDATGANYYNLLQAPNRNFSAATFAVDAEEGNQYLKMTGLKDKAQYNFYRNSTPAYQGFTETPGVYTTTFKIRYNDADGTALKVNPIFFGGVDNDAPSDAHLQDQVTITNVANDSTWVEYRAVTKSTDVGFNATSFGQFSVRMASIVDEVHLDDIKVWFKPFAANITGTFEDAEFVVSSVSTTDTTVGNLVAAFNAENPRLEITGFTYAGVEYDAATQADTVVPFPGDATIELIGTMSDLDPNAPVSYDESSIYVGDVHDSGIRFKASISNDLTPEAYGWYVTREALLTEAGYTAATAVDAFNANAVTKVVGWNYNPSATPAVTTPVINDQDDDNLFFTAVLHGIPATKEGYTDVLVAVPVTVVGGTTYYGTPVARSIYQVAKDVMETDAYVGDVATKVDAIIKAVEETSAAE